MSPSDLARRAAEARWSGLAAERASELRRLLDQGEGLKRAAFVVGVNERTARDYRARTA